MRNGEQEQPQQERSRQGGRGGRSDEGRMRNGEQDHSQQERSRPESRGGEKDDLSQEEATEEGEEEMEEGRSPNGLTAPQTVAKAEREEHEKTHIPFRSWCRACVKGRNRKHAHKKRSEEGEDGGEEQRRAPSQHGLLLHE